MPRDPVGGLVQLALGLVLGGAGMLMVGWAVTAYLNAELGFNAILWAAEHSPVPLDFDPMQVANIAIRRGSLVAAGVAGFILWAIGSGFFRAARRNLQPSAPDAGLPMPAVAPPAPAPHAGSTVFARHMLSDVPSHATPQVAKPIHVPRDPHASSAASRSAQVLHDQHVSGAASLSHHAEDRHPAAAASLSPGAEADLEGLARLMNADGRFTAQQRAVLARLTPEQHAALAKLSKWAPSRKNAIVVLIALFVAFQFLSFLISLVTNR